MKRVGGLRKDGWRQHDAALWLIALILIAGGAVGRPASADTPEAQYNFAAGLYQEKLYDQAAEQFSKFIKDNPKDTRAALATFGLAQCQQALKQYDKACATYEKLVTSYPSFEQLSETRVQEGLCYWNLQQYDKARAAFEGGTKAKDEKTRAQALYWVGECYFTGGDYANASKYYDRVIALPQNDITPYALYSAGMSRARNGDVAGASEAFHTVFTEYPKHELAPECHYRYAATLYDQKKYTEAQKEYEAVTQQGDNPNVIGPAWLGYGYCLFQQQDWQGASKAFERAVQKLDPANSLRPEAAARCGDCYYNLKQYDQAISTYKPLVDDAKNPFREHSMYWTANALRVKNDLDGALSLYQELVRTYPSGPDVAAAWTRIGDVLTQQKKYAEAIDAYKKVPSLKPDDDVAKDAGQGLNNAMLLQVAAGGDEAETIAAQLQGEPAARAWLQIGNNAFKDKQYDKAAESFTRALRTTPKGSSLQEQAMYGLAASHAQHGDVEQAISCYRKQLEAFPDGSLANNARVDLAWQLLANNQPDKVDELVDPVLRNRPKDTTVVTSAIQAAAEAAARQGKLDRALPLYQELATKYKDNPAVTEMGLFGLGSTLLAQNKFSDSADSLKQVIDHDPPADYAPLAYLRYGIALSRLGQKDDALKMFDKVLNDYPTSTVIDRVLNERGWIYLDQKKSEDALKDFQTLITKYPESTFAAEAYFHVGDYYFDQKDWTKAADAYKQITEKHTDAPFVDKALYKLGACYFNQKDYASAIPLFRQIVTKYPQSDTASQAQFWMSNALEQTNKLDDAKAGYTTFTRKYATDALIDPAWVGLARILATQKDWDGAADALKKVDVKADSGTMAEVTKLNGDIAFAHQDYKDALEAYLKVTVVYSGSPLTPEALFKIGACQEQLGNKDRAKDAYQKIVDNFKDSPYAAQAKERLQKL